MSASTTLGDKMLQAQQIHQLAMKEVGDHLTQSGFEFLAVNSQLKKDPQFVCIKDQKLHFIVVRGCLYPDNPKTYDAQRLVQVRDHGIKYKATTYYAGVGFAHAEDYELPLTENDPYAVNFDGLQIME
jgi:transcription initiation factor TFIID subunit TAF12